MSSSQPDNDQAGAGGKGIFIALVPWILFTVLASHSSLKLGSLVALAAAVVIAIPSVRSGRPKVLEVGAVVTFVGFVVVAFVADSSTAHDVARYARGIAAGVLALIAFASLFSTPFTEQYAREQVPQEYWGSSRFKAVNRKLTTMWACIFAAMVPFHIIAGAVDTRAGNIVFNWAIPLGLVVWGIKQSSAAGEAEARPAQRMA
jgi:NADH:ubiquinone oxidoreductase subunit 6 (subunit J)